MDKAIKINKKNEISYALRGIIKRELKNFEGAILDFTSAIRINPNVADYYFSRGEAKLYSIDQINNIAINDQSRVEKTRKSAITDFNKAI